MEEKAYETAKAANPSLLEALFNTLSKQQDLIYRLEERLRTVSSPPPRNEGQLIGGSQTVDSLPHLSQAVDFARRNNEHLNYIIDTIVL